MTLKIGDLAPDFTLQKNEPSNLYSLKEKYIVLYFYPKDDTPGCTIEANDFNKLQDEFHGVNALIIGVSKDSLDSHNKFKEKCGLKFDLVSDNMDICEKYGVWSEKSMFGKKYMGINRTTFLIDKNSKIAHIWPNVDVKGHAKAVLDSIKAL
jgi:thioredoxin-dependent peroxiredoxin